MKGKLLRIGLTLSGFFLGSCGGAVSISQDTKKAVMVQPVSSQPVQPESFRGEIAGRKIRILVTTYEYDFLPLGKYRTFIMTREDWFPYVNADIQGICLSLGGKPLGKSKDPFTGKEVWNRDAKDYDREWKCEGGKDPFTLRAYRGRMGGKTLSGGVSKDTYIVVDHQNPQPLVFTEEVGKLYTKYKSMDTSNWLKFFKSQDTDSMLKAFFTVASSKAHWRRAEVIEDGTVKALYATEATYFSSVMGRLLPVVHLVTLCYTKGGEIEEGNPNWVAEWEAQGAYKTYFYCKGGTQPFTFKVEPAGFSADMINYVVYIKEGVHKVADEKTLPLSVGLKTGYEDTVALTVAKTKTYYEEVREPYKYQGIYIASQGGCDYVGVITTLGAKRDIYTYKVCNGTVADRKASVPLVRGNLEVERIIRRVKENAKTLGVAMSKYHNYVIVGRAFGANLCKVEVKVLNGMELADWRLYDECR